MRVAIDDSTFEMPPRFSLIERRRAGLAEAAWERAGRGWVPGFDECSVTVADPGGRAWLERVGLAVTESFGLLADLALDRHDPLTTELCAACDLIAMQPAPLHFEANLATPQAACILLRGVALPLDGGERVQIVLSWREVLNRTATARLRRDLVAALRQSAPISPRSDPFSQDYRQKPGA
jgi:hypothetical protein